MKNEDSVFGVKYEIGKKFRRKIKPVIPFERTPSKELATGEYVVIKCRVDVTNP